MWLVLNEWSSPVICDRAFCSHWQSLAPRHPHGARLAIEGAACFGQATEASACRIGQVGLLFTYSLDDDPACHETRDREFSRSRRRYRGGLASRDDDARGGFVILTAIRFRRNDGTPKKDEHSL